jgi:hypothetical protein
MGRNDSIVDRGTAEGTLVGHVESPEHEDVDEARSEVLGEGSGGGHVVVDHRDLTPATVGACESRS